MSKSYLRTVRSLTAAGCLGLIAGGSPLFGDGLTPGSTEPATTKESNAHPPHATLEESKAVDTLRLQELNADLADRLKTARTLKDSGQFQAALETLRLAQARLRAEQEIETADQEALERRIQTAILTTVHAQEQGLQADSERLHREARDQAQTRVTSEAARSQETAQSLTIQFARLMAQGQTDAATEDGAARSEKSFQGAYDLAQQTRAIQPESPVPTAESFTARSTGFLTQSLALEQKKEFRFLQSMQDTSRAAVPASDTETMAFVSPDAWRSLSEKRIKRYGNASDLFQRDPKTQSILAKLEEPITMTFPNETPFEEVLKYIRGATVTKDGGSLPIYVDPVGLQEADRTMSSTVSIDLEGVPLKTTLRLILKQLGLTYTVNEGLVTITSESSADTPMTTRVYPVADLAIIPSSLMGNRGAGGMGGNGGGFGGGPGGMQGNGLGGGFR